MKKLYYFANNIYQFSYALPIYDKLGGTFIVRDKKKLGRFKLYLRDRARLGGSNFWKTPPVKIVPRRDVNKLKGVVVYLSNSIISSQEYPNRSITD